MTNKWVFGIDIGGTTVKCGLFSEQGELVEKQEIPTRTEENGRYILQDIATYIRNTAQEKGFVLQDIKGVGIGVPGSVLRERIVNKCINLGWGVLDVCEAFAEVLPGVPIKVGNDANMAALGEYWKGAAAQFSSVMMVTVGTGVGGGLVLDGKVIGGVHGAAAEIGHLPLVAEDFGTCNCGKKGCLEQVASATGIVRVAKKYLVQEHAASVLDTKTDFSAKDVFDAAKMGDTLAVSVVEYVCMYLGKGLAGIAAVVDPECFLIGGGVSQAGEYFLEMIRKYYRIHAFHPSKETTILAATLGNDAGMYGAAKLVL